MDTYGAVVFVHATATLLFFVAHGVSMAVAFALKRETEPARVRALLDLSRFSLGVPTLVVLLIGLAAGIVAGFMGEHWGRIWIWASLILLVVVGGAMTPLASLRLQPIRTAAGMASSGPKPVEAQPENPEEMRRLIAEWNPLPIAALGLTAFIAILWLMMEKPF